MILNQALSLTFPGYASLYVVGLLLCLGMLVPFRGRRRPQPWARYPAWLFIALLAVTLLPMISSRPGLSMTTEAVTCAGWDGAVAWSDVESVITAEDDSTIDLVLTGDALRPVALARLDEGSWRWPYWLDGRANTTVEPGATVSCLPHTLELPAGLDSAGLGRLMSLLAQLNPDGGTPPALAWCETSGHFTQRCVERATADAAACLGRADQDACREERLALP